METLTVTIHDLSRGGSGVAKLESGEIVFVPYTAPGDEIRVQITKTHKNYAEGEVIEILRPSPLRVAPRCPVFGICGGCSWQHLPYTLQFETKLKGVLHALKRAGVDTESIPVDELPADHEYHYRNRIQLRGAPREEKLGFFEKGSKKIVAIDHCPITDTRINDRLPALAREGFERFQDEFKLEIDVLPDGDEVRAAWNRPHAAFGFRQVNDEQNGKLQSWIRSHLEPAELLLDLYGGSGNLSIPLTDRFHEVRCIDLYTHKERPPHLPAHLHFIRKDIVSWARERFDMKDENRSTSIILDPPREGMSSFFSEIEAKISKFNVSSLILVGCDVDSFARDTSRFLKRGFRLERIGVLDLFPQTPHTESLALFSK